MMDCQEERFHAGFVAGLVCFCLVSFVSGEEQEFDLGTLDGSAGNYQSDPDSASHRLASEVDSGPPCECLAECSCQQQQTLAKSVGQSHKSLFSNNDFAYLCNPCYDSWWPGDSLKRRGVGRHITYDLGGQYRARLHHERNHRGLGVTGNDDDFLLHRTRLFANAEIGPRFRAHAEFIDSVSNYENLGPRPIEENRADLLNLFGDLKLYDNCGGEAWARVGRQELLYGAQRTISPLDWANTRRTFEGYKAFWQGEKWNLDAFYVRPVVPNAARFDSADYDQEFLGFYATYRAADRQTADVYYLRYNNGDANFKFDTLGTRLQGSREGLQWEVEGAYQFGENNDGSDHAAGFWVAGLGRAFECAPWSPTVWFYYDWASGDDLGAGRGYHHLFPLAHKYLGFMDLFGRSNLESPNVLVTAAPTEKIKLLVWYYYLFLESHHDTPYNVDMSAFNPGNAPASADLGHEIDLTVSYTVNARTNLLFGYSHFFAGQYYELTPGVPFRGDADFFYTQLTSNF